MRALDVRFPSIFPSSPEAASVAARSPRITASLARSWTAAAWAKIWSILGCIDGSLNKGTSPILWRTSADEAAGRPAAGTDMKRPCIECGRPSSGPRCAEHALPPRGWQHQQARAQTLAEENICWLCGKPPTPDDPLVGGHVIARARGGPDLRSNMHAMHESCNLQAGTGGTHRDGKRKNEPPYPAMLFGKCTAKEMSG
jgi:hypothetical protein